MRNRGAIHVAECAPSKAKRRPGHKGHKPLAIFSTQGQSSARKVVRMYTNLQERGWTFRFRTEATSPNGFKYAADGGSPLEAFLRAFGQWQGDFASLVPKIPAILAASTPPAAPKPAPLPVEPPKRVWTRRRIKVPLGTVSPDRDYIRRYMRVYRSERKRTSVPMAAVA